MCVCVFQRKIQTFRIILLVRFGRKMTSKTLDVRLIWTVMEEEWNFIWFERQHMAEMIYFTAQETGYHCVTTWCNSHDSFISWKCWALQSNSKRSKNPDELICLQSNLREIKFTQIGLKANQLISERLSSVNYHMTAAGASTPFVFPLLTASIIDTGLHLVYTQPGAHKGVFHNCAFLPYLKNIKVC